jgi:hypothetical protein
MNYETMQKAGFEFIRKDSSTGLYLLKEIGSKHLEWWAANKNHASYGIKFRGTHLEFCSTADKNEAPF